jgi:TAG lipase/steryl ester hydrolase/phospholipase A2/LPA acyltransferase
MRFAFSVMTQDYGADINIVPSRRYFNPSLIFSALTKEEAEDLIAEGARATWPKVEAIRSCTQVSRTIDELLLRFEDSSRDPATA